MYCVTLYNQFPKNKKILVSTHIFFFKIPKYYRYFVLYWARVNVFTSEYWSSTKYLHNIIIKLIIRIHSTNLVRKKHETV